MVRRRNFEPTQKQRDQVEMLAAVGIPHTHIAMMITHDDLPISVDTLTRHFPDELSVGLSKVMAQLGGKLVSMASGRNEKATAADELRAIMFFFNTRGQWATNSKLLVDPAEDDETDETAIAARIAGLMEKARRRREQAERDKPDPAKLN